MGKKRKVVEITTLLKHYKDTRNVIYIGEVFSRYIHLVYGLCLAKLKSRQKAQSAVMAIFDIIISTPELPHDNNFKLWLCVVTLNHCKELAGELTETDKALENFSGLMWKEDVINHYNLTEFNTESYLQATRILGSSNNNEITNTQKSYLQYFYKQKKCYADIARIEGTTTNIVIETLRLARKQLNLIIRNDGNRE